MFDKSIKLKELFHVCEKFSMLSSVTIGYGFTYLINTCLEYYIYTGTEIEITKEYILDHSVLFIWNVY